jgi:hypothetical protein
MFEDFHGISSSPFLIGANFDATSDSRGIYWEKYINPVKSFSSRAHIRICQNAPTPLTKFVVVNTFSFFSGHDRFTGYWTKTGIIGICYISKVLFIGTKNLSRLFLNIFWCVWSQITTYFQRIYIFGEGP